MSEEHKAPEADDGIIDQDELPPMSFELFVLSLNASALIQLGDPSGGGSKSDVDVPMARQTIEILTMLEEKTRGNLSGAEEHLLHQVLFDLRMRFGKHG